MAAEGSIAFIGLGVMGWPMAANLRRKMGAETELLICDVSQDAISKFQAELSDHGPIRVVASGYEALQAAEKVITMLPSAEAVEQVYLDPKTGIFAAATSVDEQGPRKLVMECGTVAQSCIDRIHAESKKYNLDFIDAPVSGGPMGSEAGTLSFMVGCPEPLFPEIKPTLEHMGTSIFRCGEVGTGSAFKIINNYISIISVLSVSEALNIGSKMGLDMHVLIDLINSSSGQCWVSSKNNPVPGYHPNAPASNGYAGGFRIELAEKVLDLGKQLAEQVGARTFLDKTALDAFHEASQDERYAGKDARVVYKWLHEHQQQD